MRKTAGFVVGIALITLLCLTIIFLLHKALSSSSRQRTQVSVTIPPDSTIYDIDRILAKNDVLPQDALINSTSAIAFEGQLFPDTYYFYEGSIVDVVVQKLINNFTAKTGSLFASSTPTQQKQALIIASLVEKEVSSSTDQAIVAGIIDKRLAAHDYLDIDATICYAKQVAHAKQATSSASTAANCSLTATDLKMNSPYNTYTHYGLPPTPIGSPDLAAIEAALHPATSSYWYYLSNPKTGMTIYAKTLTEQEANQRKYLGE